ncbi:uncharacterized protein CANTADRAFT_92065 [Suhomyces tanzawaensis NRRL Y-17324]|uniref:Uncharacterized protein n=1 Tax=Suhomyces tanzawaensis NRRL Y-17324 TaxID=984487 RepID=A0A1E4SDS0_9ASCO|nr:uncharacterized protein CANTADRAFT_92065 [Suhomyces tanzawaensis NRRL Y-17324]ODV77645.1 hypothetical protein CANTADRAFT_92065 [Suhomyces tanzawaensis NRRL Y-17324]
MDKKLRTREEATIIQQDWGQELVQYKNIKDEPYFRVKSCSGVFSLYKKWCERQGLDSSVWLNKSATQFWDYYTRKRSQLITR